jgi:hypothetical protein
MQRSAILDRAGAEPATVPDRDRPYAGTVKRLRDPRDLIDGILMRDRV